MSDRSDSFDETEYNDRGRGTKEKNGKRGKAKVDFKPPKH